MSRNTSVAGSRVEGSSRPRGGVAGGWLAAGLVALAAGVAAISVLGPLLLGALEYRTSEAVESQVLGGDAAALVVVAPVALVAAWLVWRRHPAGPVLALAPALFAAYMHTQLGIGSEWAAYDGNHERFFPLFLAVFIVAAVVSVVAWNRVDADSLPVLSKGARQSIASALVAASLFLVFGLHLRNYLEVFQGEPLPQEYLDGPTAFWIVKWMDLGIIAPLAIATAAGLLRGAAWAHKTAFAVVGPYALLSTAVAGMAIVMQVNDEAGASMANVFAMLVFSGLFLAFAAYLYWPLFSRAEAPARSSRVAYPGGAR